MGLDFFWHCRDLVSPSRRWVLGYVGFVFFGRFSCDIKCMAVACMGRPMDGVLLVQIIIIIVMDGWFCREVAKNAFSDTLFRVLEGSYFKVFEEMEWEKDGLFEGA